MHFNIPIATVLICVTAGTVGANTAEIEPSELIAITCTGELTQSLSDGFDLICQFHDPDKSALRPKEQNRSVKSGFIRQTTRATTDLDCDEPGDVMEQGVCLD